MHVIQRGNNRQSIFTCDEDSAAYANWLAEAAGRYAVAIHGWVFMTNHVHLLVTPERDDGLSMMMQWLGRLYVRYFNDAHARTGTLFEGRYKSCLVQESRYFLQCLRYIELNPVRAGVVSGPSEYRWSSYRAHALGVTPRLWSPHRLYSNLADTSRGRQAMWRRLVIGAQDAKVLSKIRQCVNSGCCLGNATFRKQIDRHRP